MLAANPARWNITRALFAPETMRRVRHATVGPKRRRRGLAISSIIMQKVISKKEEEEEEVSFFAETRHKRYKPQISI